MVADSCASASSGFARIGRACWLLCTLSTLLLPVRLPSQEPPSVVEAARAQVNAGRYAEAEQALRRSLSELESSSSPNELAMAGVLDLLIEALWRSGQAGDPQILGYGERAIEIKQRVLGPESEGVAFSHDNLGVALFVGGDYAAAQLHMERALELLSQDNALERAKVFSHLGPLHQSLGSYSRALGYYDEAARLFEQELGEEHRNVGMTLNNLATLLKDIGAYERALPLYERSLAIVEKTLGSAHPFVGIGLNNLGELHHRLGQLDRAGEHYRGAIAAKEAVLGASHPSVAISLVNLAELLLQSGEAAAAEPLLERALAIHRQAHPVPELAIALSALADVKLIDGDPAAARALVEEALALRRDLLGASHPLVAQNHDQLARARLLAGDLQGAREQAHLAESLSREHLRLTARGLQERYALSYAERRSGSLDLLLSLARSSPDPARLWDAVVRSRALVLDEMTVRHRIANTAADQETRTALASYRQVSERLAQLHVRGPGSLPIDRHRSLVSVASSELEQVERQLAARSPLFASGLAQSALSFEQVRARLPLRTGLVGYWRYREVSAGSARLSTYRRGFEARDGDSAGFAYLAFVLTGSDEEPMAVRLGSARSIEDAVRRWRQRIVEPAQQHDRDQVEELYLSAALDLRQRVWDPIEPLLEEMDRVLVVPDGALHLVNLGTLPRDQGGYLVETERQLHYLSTERDVARTAVSPARELGGRLLALGGPDFDGDPGSAGSEDGVVRTTVLRIADRVGELFRGDLDCAALSERRFATLPEAAREAREIGDLWNGSGADSAEVTTLSGSRATELAVRRRLGEHDALHFATHAFFAGSQCSPGGSLAANPLLYSGLVLAGANRRSESERGDADGVLTAQEIATLDLSAVDWVVLSACDTGIGQIRPGEGVFGLRRAFQIAGAGTVIMSLWSVRDADARSWMGELYRARLTGGRSTAAAIRAASVAVLKQRRAERLSTHPFYWGAFVGTGDWR